MEGIARLVSQSLAQHGFEPALDHRRLQWSKWFRCESYSSLLLVPSRPGLFALGEEVAVVCGASELRSPHPGPSEGSAPAGGKRVLALFRIAEAEDLGMALARLLLPGSPERERLIGGRCFACYTVIEDAAQRRGAYSAVQQWMAYSAEAAARLGGEVPGSVAPRPQNAAPERKTRVTIRDKNEDRLPVPLPPGFLSDAETTEN
jgi:hypothetical protein